MSTPVTPNTLADEHRDLLVSKAVDPDVAIAAGVYTARTVADLPPGSPSSWSELLPALMYKWDDGVETEWQICPPVDLRPRDADGREIKYLFKKDADVRLSRVRETGDNGPVLLCEGSKQHLAVLSVAPMKYSVYGVSGCWNWGGLDMSFVEDRDVTVIFDGDLTRNQAVWDAAERLKETLDLNGATTVAFARVPVGKDNGIDDYLGTVALPKRQDHVERMVGKAKKTLGKRPSAKAAAADGPDLSMKYFDPFTGQLLVETLAKDIHRDNPMMLTATTESHRVALYRNGCFRINESAFTGAVTTKLRERYTKTARSTVDEYSVGMLYMKGLILPTHVDRPLLNLQNGMLDLVNGVLLPHDPKYRSWTQLPVSWDPDAKCPVYEAWLTEVCPKQIEDLEESLSYMLDPSRTPSKAVFLYGPSRSGKSTMLRLATLVAGEENTSAVTLQQLGSDNFAAANLFGKVLNSAADLSSAHVEDLSIFKQLTGEDPVNGNRKYGKQFKFTNRALFAFSANELPTVAESSRAYIERVKPFKFGNSFAGHEDPAVEEQMRLELPGILVRWVAAWRARLDRGYRLPTDDEVMSEFETRSDRVRQWVAETCRVVAEVNGVAVSHGMVVGQYDGTPPRILARRFNQWAESNGGSRMGERKVIDRLTCINGVHEVRVMPTKGRALNVVEATDDDDSVAEVALSPYKSQSENVFEGVVEDSSRLLRAESATPATTVVFDFETCDATTLFSRPDFLRLGGYQVDDGAVVLTTDAQEVSTLLSSAALITGHNIMGFDLIALAQHHGLDIHALAARGAIHDTLITASLVDPPPARESDSAFTKKYDLDTLGEQYLGRGKTDDIMVLAKKHGGLDQIPTDDPEYRAYLTGDVELSAALAPHLPLTDYAIREHRIAAICATMSVNGFKVDTELLEDRFIEGEQRKARINTELIEVYGLPSTKKDGKPNKNPLATDAGKARLDEVLRTLGLPKGLPKTATGVPSTGSDIMDKAIPFLRSHGYDEGADLCSKVKEVNGVRTIYSTMRNALVGDRVHPQFNTRQASGRFSISPGMTVLGKRGEGWRERQIFIPEDGHVIITADLAQVDARAVAVHSQDPDYMALFEPGRDSHTEIAMMVWGDPGRRSDAKVIGHGYNYGLGINNLLKQHPDVSTETAQEFYDTMRTQFPRLSAWQREVRREAEVGLLDNGWGRLMRPEAGREYTQAPALMGQGCARDILCEGLLRLNPSVYPFLRLTVHDEIVASVPEALADEVEAELLRALQFEWAPPHATRPIKIIAEVGDFRGTTWGNCYHE